MKAEFVKHKNESRIKVVFNYDDAIIRKLRTIQGATWSATMKSWHIPDNKESCTKLLQLFSGLILPERTDGEVGSKNLVKGSGSKAQDTSRNEPEKRQTMPELPLKTETAYPDSTFNRVGICLSNDFIYLKLKKDNTDIAFIRSLRFYKWDKAQLHWIITNTKQNRELVEKYFGERLLAMAMPQLITRQAVEKMVEKSRKPYISLNIRMEECGWCSTITRRLLNL